MSTFNGTENEFELNGVTYIAKQQQVCAGCAFNGLDDCGYLSRPHCDPSCREDHVSVIFIRKPATPESHPIMTSTKHTPAPTTAKPLDFSKPVQTRNGIPVRILCTDRNHPEFTVVGLWMDEYKTEVVEYWTAEGDYWMQSTPHHLDLIQVPQPRKHAELIKRWAEDDSMRVKCKYSDGEWHVVVFPDFDPEGDYEEILPGDPLY